MVTRLKEVDAVTVGLGWTGAIMARELTKAGLNVVSLENGPDRIPGEDFVLPAVRDEVRYAQRLELMMDNSIDTLTFRNFAERPGAADPPHRRVLAGRRRWRLRHSLGRLALALSAVGFPHPQRAHRALWRKAFPDDMTIQDWPVSYDELEPFYDYFDKICGVSGQAGNVRGKKIDGGNVFEGPRSDQYPNEPIKSSNAGLMYAAAAKSLGYHPFPAPVAIASAPLRECRRRAAGRLRILRLSAIASPARPTPRRRRIRPSCRRCGLIRSSRSAPALFVTKLNYDKAAKKVVSVTYTDMRNGEEYEQPAGIVLLTSYVFGNVQHMLLAGIGEPYDHATGKGVVGKNYAYQFEAGANAFFEDKELNPYWGSAGMGVAIDDFNGENFDHGGLGFFGGGYIACNTACAPPIAGRTVPHGTPEWGSEWKRATVKWYHHAARFNTQGSVYANRDNFMDLDPTYKDALRPAADPAHLQSARQRIQDVAYLLQKLEGVIKAMNPTHYELHPRPKNLPWCPISRPTIPAAP